MLPASSIIAGILIAVSIVYSDKILVREIT